LGQLNDNGILTKDEYEEQWEDLIESMCNLKEEQQTRNPPTSLAHRPGPNPEAAVYNYYTNHLPL